MAPKSRYSQQAVLKSAKQKEHEQNWRIAWFNFVQSKKKRYVVVDCCCSSLLLGLDRLLEQVVVVASLELLAFVHYWLQLVRLEALAVQLAAPIAISKARYRSVLMEVARSRRCISSTLTIKIPIFDMRSSMARSSPMK